MKRMLTAGDVVTRSFCRHAEVKTPTVENQLQRLRETLDGDDPLVPAGDLVLASLLLEMIDGVLGHYSSCESPIERAFLSALLLASRGWSVTLRSDACDDSVVRSECEGGERLLVDIQPSLEPYRADFIVRASVPPGPWASVVVECDGHDFHERTKEQAARDKSRDRALQTMGFGVFRYTGSEIWKDACACATQTLEHVEGRAREAYGKLQGK